MSKYKSKQDEYFYHPIVFKNGQKIIAHFQWSLSLWQRIKLLFSGIIDSKVQINMNDEGIDSINGEGGHNLDVSPVNKTVTTIYHPHHLPEDKRWIISSFCVYLDNCKEKQLITPYQADSCKSIFFDN